jgi:hypothetical protein
MCLRSLFPDKGRGEGYERQNKNENRAVVSEPLHIIQYRFYILVHKHGSVKENTARDADRLLILHSEDPAINPNKGISDDGGGYQRTGYPDKEKIGSTLCRNRP